MHTERRFGPAGIDLLEDRECLRLLRTVPVGRVVFTRGGLPAVRVVGFRVDEDTIVFVADDEGRGSGPRCGATWWPSKRTTSMPTSTGDGP